MNKFKDEIPHSISQLDRDDKNGKRTQEMEGQVHFKANTENPDCTCHTGKCTCQEK